MKTLLIILGVAIGGFVAITMLAGLLFLCFVMWDGMIDDFKHWRRKHGW